MRKAVPIQIKSYEQRVFQKKKYAKKNILKSGARKGKNNNIKEIVPKHDIFE